MDDQKIKEFKEELAKLLEKYQVEIDFDYLDSYCGSFNHQILVWNLNGQINEQVLLSGKNISIEKLRQ